MRPSPTVPVAIVLGGLLVAYAVYASLGGTFSFGSTSQGNPSLVRAVGVADHILGNPAAPVVIVEYCDFASDYCKGFSDTLTQMVGNVGNRGAVAVVYRAFPLTEINRNALAHARAAECVAKVGGNDAFWAFADLLFANQPADSSRYGEFAKQANAPGEAFATCYADAANQVDARITADRKNAAEVGASGTPYSLILTKGRAPVVVDGAYSYDALKMLVDDALAKASQ